MDVPFRVNDGGSEETEFHSALDSIGDRADSFNGFCVSDTNKKAHRENDGLRTMFSQ